VTDVLGETNNIPIMKIVHEELAVKHVKKTCQEFTGNIISWTSLPVFLGYA
jgi:hypothetical protein